MADENNAERLDALRRYLGDLPDALNPSRQRGGVYDFRTQVLEPCRTWLARLMTLAGECGPILRNPVAGEGLDSAWVRSLCGYLAGFEEVAKTAGLGEALSRYHDDLGMKIQECHYVAYTVVKLRQSYTPGGIAGLLAGGETDPFDRIREIANECETLWAEASLPPYERTGALEIQNAKTAARRELDKTDHSLREETGKLFLRATDDLLIPDSLRCDESFADTVYRAFRGGYISGVELFERLVTDWLPKQREGYGGKNWEYPGAAEDDAKRYNLGVRRARCAIALADALSPRSAAADELLKMAQEAAAEKSRQADREARFEGRYENHFRPYDAVWLDLQHAPCNPVADKPLDPEWLVERLTTLAGRARSLDEFDGGTGEIDRLRWLRNSPPAIDNRIARAFAVAISAAVEGDFNRDAATAVCGMLESHPGNELRALYRAYPPSDTRPRFEPMNKAANMKPHEQVGTVAWLVSELSSVEWYAQRAAEFGAKIVGPVVKGTVEEHYRMKQREEAADRETHKKRIADADGAEELRAWLNYNDITWMKAGVEKQRDRLFVEQGIARVEADALSLNEFLSRLREPCANTSAARPTHSSLNKNVGNLIDRLIAGPDDVELSSEERASVEAYLKQPVSLSAIQREKREAGESATQARRNKLKLVLDFNRRLQGKSSESSQGPNATEEPATYDDDNLPQSVDELEQATPKLDRENGKWVKNKRAAELEGLEIGTLSDYRVPGEKTDDQMFGRDKDGRIWRREGTPKSHPWYLRDSLRSEAKS